MGIRNIEHSVRTEALTKKGKKIEGSCLFFSLLNISFYTRAAGKSMAHACSLEFTAVLDGTYGHLYKYMNPLYCCSSYWPHNSASRSYIHQGLERGELFFKNVENN